MLLAISISANTGLRQAYMLLNLFWQRPVLAKTLWALNKQTLVRKIKVLFSSMSWAIFIKLDD